MIKAIIFDFDGEIGDTYQINFDVSRLFDSNFSTQDFVDHHMGNVFEKPKINFKVEDIPIFFEKQQQLFNSSHFFINKDHLKLLKNNFQLFIVSSTVDSNLNQFLAIGGMGEYFQAVLGSTTHKSKVEKFRMIFARYHIQPEECLFVTDTVGDIIEARHFNIKTIAVSWGYHKKELLAKHEPFAIVDTPEELIKLITKTPESLTK